MLIVFKHSMTLCAVVFFLLWSNVDVDSHAVPYITFMGETLPNNSYLDVRLVNSDGAGVQCHTDLTTCCSRHQGNDSGDWYAPDSVTRLPFQQSGTLNAAFEHRGSQTVTLYRRSRHNITVFQSGIYRCDIAVNGSKRGTVYAGLYDTGGIIAMCHCVCIVCWKCGNYVQSLMYTCTGYLVISGIFMSTHSILTCTSTGGPATNVTWMWGSDEDNLIPVSDNMQVSVLVNATTAEYVHTLNVTGTKYSAVYGCSVSNNKPSSAEVIATLTSNGMAIRISTSNIYYLTCVLLPIYTLVCILFLSYPKE